jgi:hypothetical protein
MRVFISIIVGMLVMVTEVVMAIQHLGGIDRVSEFLKALVVMSLIGAVIALAWIAIWLWSSAFAALLVYWLLGLLFGSGERAK